MAGIAWTGEGVRAAYGKDTQGEWLPAERFPVNWTNLAQHLGGPTKNDTTDLAGNAGQAWLGLMRTWRLINADAIAPQRGDRGFHARRSKPYRVKIGCELLCLKNAVRPDSLVRWGRIARPSAHQDSCRGPHERHFISV